MSSTTNIPKLKFSHMEPVSCAREDGGEITVYLDKDDGASIHIVAVITKHMDEDPWGGGGVACYEASFYNSIGLEVDDRDFCPADYPSARAALAGAKAWIKQIYAEFAPHINWSLSGVTQ